MNNEIKERLIEIIKTELEFGDLAKLSIEEMIAIAILNSNLLFNPETDVRAKEPCGLCKDMNNQKYDIQLKFAVIDMPEVPEYKSFMPIIFCPQCGRKIATELEAQQALKDVE